MRNKEMKKLSREEFILKNPKLIAQVIEAVMHRERGWRQNISQATQLNPLHDLLRLVDAGTEAPPYVEYQ